MTNPNDTLRGRLLTHEIPEEKHLRKKLGYWRMVEERVTRAELIAEGHDPKALGFWTAMRDRMEANHKDDECYAVTSARFSVSGMVAQQARAERDEMVRNATDAAIDALRRIAEGHNDPRNLALEVLLALDAI